MSILAWHYINILVYLNNLIAMKKVYIVLSSILITCISYTDALYAFTFSRQSSKERDVADNPGDGSWIVWDYSIMDVIKLVNSYLRFGVGLVCFLFMIVNGYKLITAHGDEKVVKEATGALWKSIIWVIICILSYIVVNLAVKLFA